MIVANGGARLVTEPVDSEVYEVPVYTYEGKVLPRREGRDMDTTKFWILGYDMGTSRQGKEVWMLSTMYARPEIPAATSTAMATVLWIV